MSSTVLSRAIEAIRQGETEKGRDLLYEVIGEDEKNELAWMWLATCHESVEQKIQCLEKVLEINPNNVNARKGIEKLHPKVEEPDLDAMISIRSANGVAPSPDQRIQQSTNSRSIQFIPANCPNCGGELRVPADKSSVKCMYCGHEVLIHDPTKIDINLRMKIDITKPLKLAQVS